MATKYIVDNIPNQTIQGNLTINGDLYITGVTTTSICSYKALLTQTGPILGTDLGTFGGQLLIGETYTIDNYMAPDDFSNIANVQSGLINQTGCVFIATGTTPTSWFNGSQLTSVGGLIVNEIENNLGYDLYWVWNAFGGSGYYVAINNTTGPINNSFPRLDTQVFCQTTYPYDNQPSFNILPGVVNFMATNNLIIVNAFDLDTLTTIDNLLYYTPIEIRIKQDMTPIVLSGAVIDTYPINNVSVRLDCDGNTVETYYGNLDNANNITELVSILNTDTDTNFLGTYSDAGDGGVLLTMTTHIANIFCPNGTLTFEVFAD